MKASHGSRKAATNRCSSSLSFEDRIRGGIYGALVGDALGVPVEFTQRAERDRDPVTDLRGFGTWNQPPGTWSDDGAMLLCTAEAATAEFSLSEFGRLYLEWMRAGHWSARGNVFDIGATTGAALTRLANGDAVEAAGAKDEYENGNGSLMRTLPLAFRHVRRERELLVKRAMAVSAITHAHPRACIACAFYSAVALGLTNGCDLFTAIDGAAAEVEPLWTKFPDEKAHFARIVDHSLFSQPRGGISSGAYVIDTLEASLWCAHQHQNFQSAVLAAVNLGGDTDTTGSVTGGLAGIMYGYDAIPRPWLDALPRRLAIDDLLNRFTRACAVE